MPKSTDSFSGLLKEAVSIWDQKAIARELGVERETVNRWLNGKEVLFAGKVQDKYFKQLKNLFPKESKRKKKFQFIDLFAGIGGIRKGFESIGGECVFTSEWNEQAVRTYKANHYCNHPINGDIREITEGAPEDRLMDFIDRKIPDHHVLLAGFPCQPFSIAGVSKKNAMGRSHGFDCKIQGTLFFDICKVIKAKEPACFLLENVKNLKSHNKGDTYKTIIKELEDLGYDVPDPRVIDASAYVPQHRERIVIVGFREDLAIADRFDFEKVQPGKNFKPVTLREILDSDNEVDEKYTLTEGLWNYLQRYKEKHRSKGNGFGYDLFTPESVTTRTLSARYYKDGSEILLAKSDEHAAACERGEARPRRLTPRECARLMGFEASMESKFKMPVSDTQAYKQFGNSVVVPVFEAVAKQMKLAILDAVEQESTRFTLQRELELREKAAKYAAN